MLCTNFYSFRCGKRTVCGTGDDKHDMVDLSEVAVAAENKLQQWQMRTKNEV